MDQGGNWQDMYTDTMVVHGSEVSATNFHVQSLTISYEPFIGEGDFVSPSPTL